MTRKLSTQEKLNRRPASRACRFCHRKHLQCSNERPCKNCVKRDIAHQCQDIERKKAKYLRQSEFSDSQSRGSPEEDTFNEQFNLDSSSVSVPPSDPTTNTSEAAATKTQNSVFPRVESVNTTDEVLSKLFSVEMKPSHSDYLDNVFDSNYLDQEYKMLGDIITNSKPTSPTPSGSMNTSVRSKTPTFISPAMFNEDKLKDTRPFISFGVPEESIEEQDQIDKQFQSGNTNHDTNVDLTTHLKGNISSNTYMSPLATHQVYKAVQDIYSNDIIYFDYPSSYHSLTFFLKTRFSGKNLPEDQKQAKRNNLLIILKLISSYRPTFISAHKSLYKPWDLQFLEMTFQRSLIDFEKLSQLNSSPTIIWRRTGEIVSISKELVSLLNWNTHNILSKRTFIMELMYDDESVINYFQLFKSVAVGNLHSSILTKCKLIKLEGADQAKSGISQPISGNDKYMEFCSVWTVKRDIFDIPMLILGQFLPILSPTENFRMY